MEITEQVQEQEERRTVVRVPSVSIQHQWRQVIEKTLYNFIQASPLKDISSNLSPDFYGNMSPFLVKEVIRMSNAVDGVRIALQTTLETMKEICKDATYRMYEQSEFKSKQSITLLCETLSMPSMTLEELEENDDLRERTPLQVQDIVMNDKHRGWLSLYREAKAENINVFTVKIGPGLTKATPETGRYVLSLLMPLQPSGYRLLPINDSYSQSFEELNCAYRKTLIELNSYKRIAEQDASAAGKRTTLADEAREMAGQIQNRHLRELKIENDDQSITIAMLSRQVEELNTAMNGVGQVELNSKNETILILREKLHESRMRNLKLESRLRENGISTDLTVQPGEPKFDTRKALAAFKENKLMRRQAAIQQMNKRNTASSTSSSYQEKSCTTSSSFSSSSSSSCSSSSHEEEDDEDVSQ